MSVSPATVPAPRRRFLALFITLALSGLIADQATKYGLFHRLYAEGTRRGELDVAPGWFRFTAEYEPATEVSGGLLGKLQTVSAPVMPRVNNGALFGLGTGYKAFDNGLFAAVSALAALAIAVWAVRGPTRTDRWLSAALGLLWGGTVGNFYDRVVFSGVRDFLHFYKPLPVIGEWPVFNVADCCLVVGVTLLVLHALLTPSETTPAPAGATSPPGPLSQEERGGPRG